MKHDIAIYFVLCTILKKYQTYIICLSSTDKITSLSVSVVLVV